MMKNCPCREDLLHWINIVSFAVNDVQLFLDTHPDCQEALAFFEEMKCQRTAALQEYASLYGPLTIDTTCTDRERWQWVQSPWPWQKGGC